MNRNHISQSILPVLDLEINRACHVDEERCKGKADKTNVSGRIGVAADVSEFRTNVRLPRLLHDRVRFHYVYRKLSELSFSFIANVNQITKLPFLFATFRVF